MAYLSTVYEPRALYCVSSDIWSLISDLDTISKEIVVSVLRKPDVSIVLVLPNYILNYH